MPKIRIIGRNLSRAEDGFQTTNQTTCPPGYVYAGDKIGCVKSNYSEVKSTGPIKFDNYQQKIGPRIGSYLKNKVGAWMGDTESRGSLAKSLLDPTGISNWPFLNKAMDEFAQNPSVLNGLSLGVEAIGSVPVYGQVERVAEAAAKPAWKSLTSAQKTARVIKAPVRAGQKTLHAIDVAASSPARAVDYIYTKFGVKTPMLANKFNTLNRGIRGWELGLSPFHNQINTGVTKAQLYTDPDYRALSDQDKEAVWQMIQSGDIPQKSLGGEEDGCPVGKCKDPVTLRCVPCLAVPKNTNMGDPWAAWSNNTDINQPAPPLPQKTIVDASGNTTTTGGVDIGNPKLYEVDPNQTSKVNLYEMKGKCQPGYSKDKNGNCVPNKNPSVRDLTPYIDIALNTVSGISDFFQAKKNQKDWNRQFRQNILPDNRYVAAQADKGWVRTNEGDWVGAGYKTQNFGEYGGSMLKDSNMDKIKIKITGGHKEMAYGGQLGYGFDLGQRNTYAAMPKGKTQTVSKEIPEVPREEANIEAEKGETVYADVDGDGVQEHMNIGGKKHTEGGTPLNVPEGSFVFSDTKKMKIKDSEILAKFGLSARKEGYTPAEIAKKYDVNKYKAIIEDVNSDSVMKNTAMLMVKNYQKKLAELALIQEEMKGFPQGIPEMCRGVLPDDLLNKIDEELAARQPKDLTNPEDREVVGKVQQMAQENGLPVPAPSDLSDIQEEETPEEEIAPEEEPEMMYGGDLEYGGDLSYFEDDDVPESEYGGDIPKMQLAGQTPPKGQVQWLSPELQNAITTINQQTGQKVIVSPRVTSGDVYIPPTQHKQATGLFGDVTPAEIEEFKKRHAWYFKDRPDWDYKNDDDVLDFQTRYDEEFAKKHGFQYFVGTTGFNKKDAKLGEYTYNAPGLETAPPDTSTPDYITGYTCTGRDGADKPQIQQSSFRDVAARNAAGAYATESEAIKNQCPPKGKTEPGTIGPAGKPTPVPFQYMTPDLVGIGVAAGMRGHKYLPYIAETAYEPGRYLPEDWKAKASQLKSLSEQIGKQIGDYMPGQNLQASLSNMYGQNAEALIGAIADVDARNVRGVNAFNQAEQERKDKFNLLRSANATERWKGNVIANQQWDNFLNKKADLVYNRYQNAWTNRMNLGLENAVNKYYYIDPVTGRLIFKGGYGPQNLGASTGTANWDAMGTDYARASTALPGLTPSDYLKTIGKTGTGKYGGTLPMKKQKNSRMLADVLFNGHRMPF